MAATPRSPNTPRSWKYPASRALDNLPQEVVGRAVPGHGFAP
jgi:hypothetical protein